MKFKIRERDGFRIYTSEDGRVKLHECQWRERVQAGWGLRAHGKTRKGFNVFVDGRLVRSQVEKLGDAKEYAEEALKAWSEGKQA